MASDASARTARDRERFVRRTDLPLELLRALAAHAARLAQAGEAAIVCWPRDGNAAPPTVISTSQAQSWLGALRSLGAAAEGGSGAIATRRSSERTVAIAGLKGPGLRGILAVGRPPRDQFAGEQLDLLEDVAALVVAALLSESRRAPATAPPTVDPNGPSLGAPAINVHHRLPRAFERLEGLPALSESRDRLLSLFANGDPSPAAIVSAIESDVALVIAALRLANRGGGKRGGLWSVPEAIRALSPEGVEQMARRITVFDFFQRIAGWTVPPERFRLHAVATQRAAHRLARLVDHPGPDHLVVAALLHDVGKLVLMEAFDAYPDQIVGAAHTPLERLRAERHALGLDHQMAGGVLLRRWGLPDRLAEIVARHHSPGEDREAQLIGLADGIAHYASGRPVVPGEIEQAASALGITTAKLRTVMFELSETAGAGGPPRAIDPSPLSARETEMVRHLAAGRTYKEMAAAAGCSTSTVRTHLHNVYRKLDVVDRAQAVLVANERGWI